MNGSSITDPFSVKPEFWSRVVSVNSMKVRLSKAAENQAS
jgi:hypothetical protein